MTTASEPCVYIVDDDQSVLRALSRLISSAGYQVRAFDSPISFLREHDPDVVGCAILDVRMPELDGLSVQEWLEREGTHRQVVFLSGQDDVETSVRTMKAGAADYLTKPAQDSVVLAAVAHAIEADEKARRERTEVQRLNGLFETLTAREKDVLNLVVRGNLNKQVAFELGIVEKTVKVHRSRVMQKLQVRSFAQLLWVGRRLGLVDSGDKK